MPGVKLNFIFFTILISLLGFQQASAQQTKRSFFQRDKLESNRTKPDTSILYPYKIIRGNYYILNGNLVFARTDSLVYVKDTNKVIFQQKGVQRKDALISTLQEKSKGNIITNGIFNQLIKPTPEITTHSGEFNRADLFFIPYKNKTISSISIKKIGIYGVTVEDTTYKSNDWYYNLLNKTHINTHDSKIEKSLLIKVGDKIDPYILADNEKLLRSFPFIQDAKIVVKINETDTTKANVTIITQDAYPLVIGGTFYDFNNSRLDISNNNLLGMGQQFINKIYLNLPSGWEYNYNGQYKINNIGGSFINTMVEYYHVNQSEYTGMKVFRNFVTSNTLYAGSASWYRYNNFVDLNNFPENDNILVQKRIVDSWLGRNFPFEVKINDINYRSGFTLTGRYLDIHHIKRPFIAIDSNTNYFNLQRYLIRTGFYLSQSFKSNMIFNSGTTEDIPTGVFLESLAGYEKNDFFDRYYLGSSLTTGFILPHQFYAYLKTQTGTFINSQKKYTPALAITGTFISPLLQTKIALFRQFISFKYFGSKQGYLSQPVDLTIKGGIRNFPSKTPAGNYMLSSHLETIYYPNLYYYGFGITYFSFLDIGVISKDRHQMLKNPKYTGIGAGLRLRNQNFVFNSVEIKLCWFPNLNNVDPWAFFASSEQTLDLDKLTPGVPEIVEP